MVLCKMEKVHVGFRAHFRFGCADEAAEEPSVTRVRAQDRYHGEITCASESSSYRTGISIAEECSSQDRGSYGFVTEAERMDQELLRLSELNSGFEPVWWYQDTVITQLEENRDGCYIDSAALADKWQAAGRSLPLVFKMDVRPGNYRVTVKALDAAGGQELLIFAGRRHLIYKGKAEGGAQAVCTVNVSPIIPRGKEISYADTSLDIAVLGNRPQLTEVIVEEVTVPVLYIAGDSTVTDQSAEYPYAPAVSYSGWGQMLSAWLTEGVAVSNHAHSGLTTESFRQEGHYAILEEEIKPGDYVCFQFAHNDQKLDHLKAYEGYRENLIRYIEEVRAKGAYPILVTPLARNTWKGSDASYNDLLKEYAQSVNQLAAEMEVPVADLHRYSMEFITRTGLEAAKAWFYPADYTHTNDYGAYLMAGFVSRALAEMTGGYSALGSCVTLGCGDWTPDGPFEPAVLPAGLEGKENPAGQADGFALPERPEDLLSRGEALDMIIQTMKFFPTNVYNDMYRDVIGHEWYAGSVQCAYQNGLIPEAMVEDGCFRPAQPVTRQEYLAMLMNGFRSRRTITPASDAAAFAGIQEYARRAVMESIALGILEMEDDLTEYISRQEAAGITHKLKL